MSNNDWEIVPSKKTSSEWEVVSQPHNLLMKGIKSDSSLSEMRPETKEIGTGFKEQAMQSLRAIPGAEKIFGKQQEMTPVPNISGAGTARTIGRMGGGAAVMAPMAMGLGEILSLGGLPALAAQMGGWGTSGALTTPGGAFSRIRGAAEGAIPAGIAKGAPYLFKGIAAKPYQLAREGLKEAGIANIAASTKLINDAKQFLPKTEAYRELIKKAKTGNIEALFDLQSDLGKISGELASFRKNPFSAAERQFGRAGLQTREALLGHKSKELEKMGLKEIADLLEKGRKQYKIYKKVHPYKMAAITGGAGVVARELGVPGMIMKYLLSRNSD